MENRKGNTEEVSDMQLIEDQLDADYKMIQQAKVKENPDQWLPQWYLGQIKQADALTAELDNQYKTMKNEILRRKQYLAFRWGGMFKDTVDRDLAEQKGKKKSVNYLTGKAGYRSSKETILIQDAKAVLEWATEHCPEALDMVVKRKTPIMDFIRETGEIPEGVEFLDKRESFYPFIETKSLGRKEDDRLENE